MPSVVTWVAVSLIGALGVGTATGIAATFAFSTAFVYGTASWLLNKAIKALSPRPRGGRGLGLELNTTGTAEPRRIIYGQQKVGGLHVIPGFCTGEDGKYLHIVLAIAGHEVSDMTDVYLDQDVISDASIAAISASDSSGAVGSGKYDGLAWIRRYLGTSTDAADYILTQAYPSAFTSDFRGRGVAKIMLRLKYNKKVFASGLPNITVMTYGKKVYDPRLDSTNGGSGSHRYTDDTTWAYSTNNALCTRDFLVNEVGFDNDEMDDTTVAAAANVCDATVAIPTAATQKRYECNVTLFANTPWEDSLKTLVDSMFGRAVWRDGRWRLYAGAWDTPSSGLTITKADWVSPTVVKTSVDRDERWNAVRCFYVDPNRNWQYVECFPRTNTTYEADDGDERIWREIELPTCINEYQAQRIAELTLRLSRNQTRISGRLRPQFIQLATWDTITVTDDEYGWSSKTFRVLSMDNAPDGSVDVALVEDGSAGYTDLAEGEYTVPTTAPTIDPGATFPTVAGTLVATPGAGRIDFAWDEGEGALDGQTYRVLESVNSYDPSSASEVWRGLGFNATVAKTDVTTRFYWVQGQVGSYYGLYSPSSWGLPAAANSLSADGTPGTYAPRLQLTSDANVFRYSGSDTNIGVNTINFNVLLDALPGATAGIYAKNFRADGTALNSYALAGTGNSNRILNANSFHQAGSTAYCTVVASVVGSYYDIITIHRVKDGPAGSQGSAGLDSLAGYLTNEAHTLVASSNGNIADYAGASGVMRLFEGITQVNVNSITFATSAVSPVGMTVPSSTNGAYAITAGIGVSDNTGIANIRGTYKSVPIDKLFTVSKSIAGAPGNSGTPAQTLQIIATGQQFRYSGSGTNIGVNTLGFYLSTQNVAQTPEAYANNFLADGTLINSVGLAAAANSYRMLHINSFTQAGSTAYATIVASVNGGLFDRVTVVRLQEGAGGAAGSQGSAGLDALIGYLTNEAHTLPASYNGYVPAYTGANGALVLMLGVSSVVPGSVAYTTPNNPQTLTHVFSTNGTFAVTGGFDVGEDLATLTLRGTYNAVAVDKVFTLAKSKSGITGASGTPAQTLQLIGTGQEFRYSGSGTNIGVNTVGFYVNLQNIAGTAAIYANNFRADGTLINSLALTAPVTSYHLFHINSFTQGGSTAYATIVASVAGGFFDRMSVIRLQEGAGGADGAAGLDALVGLLTNENHTLAASYNGYIPSYAGANGIMELYEGASKVAVTSITFASSAVSPVGMTVAHSTNGAYAVTAGIGVSDTQGLANIRGTYKGTPINKIFTVAKAKGGATGAPGSAGDPGGMGPPGSNLLQNGEMLYVNSITGRLAGWDGFSTSYGYNTTAGPNNDQCMTVTAVGAIIKNEAIIPFDPFTDELTISVQAKSVTSGSNCFLFTDPMDMRRRSIHSAAGNVGVLTTAFATANSGATTIQLRKWAAAYSGQTGMAATVGSNTLIYGESIGWANGDPTFAYENAVSGWPRYAHRGMLFGAISAINTAASTSYDTVTLTSGLQIQVLSGSPLAIGHAGLEFQHLNGAVTTLTSYWTEYSWVLRGMKRTYIRRGDDDPTATRPGTRFVRVGLVGNYSGVNAQNQFANFRAVKRTREIPSNEIMIDPDMTFGAGMWMIPLGTNSPQFYYSPNSGGPGGAILIRHLNSSDTTGLSAWDNSY